MEAIIVSGPVIGLTGFYLVLPSFFNGSRLSVVPSHFTGFYLVLQGHVWSYLVFDHVIAFYWALPSFTGFRLVPLSFT